MIVFVGVCVCVCVCACVCVCVSQLTITLHKITVKLGAGEACEVFWGLTWERIHPQGDILVWLLVGDDPAEVEVTVEGIGAEVDKRFSTGGGSCQTADTIILQVQ